MYIALLCPRVDEHKAAIKYGKSDVSGVAEHVWVDRQDVDFQSVSVLAWEPDLHQCCLWNPGISEL